MHALGKLPPEVVSVIEVKTMLGWDFLISVSLGDCEECNSLLEYINVSVELVRVLGGLQKVCVCHGCVTAMYHFRFGVHVVNFVPCD